MRTLVVIQARTGSTRCPGKVLATMAGQPMLLRMLQRVLAARSTFEVAVATTQDPADDAVVEIGRRLGVRTFRGHPTDLLDRHYRVALEARADVVVKIPSDCPLIDPTAIERVIAAFVRSYGGFDFVSNLHPATWPDGNDVEVIPMALLELAWCDADVPWEREHTTPFLWDQPDRFRIGNVTWETGLDLSASHRFAVDYPEDLAFVRAIYDELWTVGAPVFSLGQILDLVAERPWLAKLNAHRIGKAWWTDPGVRLRTAGLPIELFGAVGNTEPRQPISGSAR